MEAQTNTTPCAASAISRRPRVCPPRRTAGRTRRTARCWCRESRERRRASGSCSPRIRSCSAARPTEAPFLAAAPCWPPHPHPRAAAQPSPGGSGGWGEDGTFCLLGAGSWAGGLQVPFSPFLVPFPAAGPLMSSGSGHRRHPPFLLWGEGQNRTLWRHRRPWLLPPCGFDCWVSVLAGKSERQSLRRRPNLGPRKGFCLCLGLIPGLQGQLDLCPPASDTPVIIFPRITASLSWETLTLLGLRSQRLIF